MGENKVISVYRYIGPHCITEEDGMYISDLSLYYLIEEGYETVTLNFEGIKIIAAPFSVRLMDGLYTCCLSGKIQLNIQENISKRLLISSMKKCKEYFEHPQYAKRLDKAIYDTWEEYGYH